MSHRPPPPTKQPTEESGNWPTLVITGREPAEIVAEGHQTKGQPARGGKTPGRARGDSHRRAPDEGATGSRRENTGREPAEQAAEGARGRSDGLAAGKSPGEPVEQAAEGRQRQERRARGGKTPGRARGDSHRGTPGAGATGSQVNNYRGKGRKPGDAEAEQRPRCTVKPGMTQADGRPAERVSPISA